MHTSETVCITGANGLLGQALCRRLAGRPAVEVLPTSRDEEALADPSLPHRRMDITEPASVRSVLREAAPDAVVHCAAQTQVDDCETDPERCRSVNVDGLAHVVDAANAVGARIVHLSTDFVFDGASGPYGEGDEPGPVNTYGAAKLESERLLAERAEVPWAIARTVLVYGTGRELSRSNIALWIIDELARDRAITIVTDQVRTPTYVEDLAAGIEGLLRAESEGVFHLAGPDLVTVYEFARRIARVFDFDPSLVEPTTSEALGQTARRPPRTGLRIEKARGEFGFQPRSITAALHDLKPLVDWPRSAAGDHS